MAALIRLTSLFTVLFDGDPPFTRTVTFGSVRLLPGFLTAFHFRWRRQLMYPSTSRGCRSRTSLFASGDCSTARLLVM